MSSQTDSTASDLASSPAEKRCPVRDWLRAPRLVASLPWLAVLYAIMCAVVWFISDRQPHGMAADEIEIANLAHYWKHGVIPYFGTNMPLVFDPYGAVYPLIVALLAKLGANAFIAGRVVSLLAIAACLVALCFTQRARWAGGCKTWAWILLSAVLVLTARPAFTFAMRCRVDALLVGFAVVGFVVAVRGKSRTSIFVAAILMALSTGTKLTSVAAPIAATIVLWHDRKRDAKTLLLTWFVLTAAGYLTLQIISGGKFIASVARVPGHWNRSLEMALRPFLLPIFWSIALIVAWVRVKPLAPVADDDLVAQRERTEFRQLCWYGGLSYAVAVVTGAGWGSHWGYLLEFFVIWGMLFASLMTRVIARHDTATLRLVMGLLALHFVVNVPSMLAVGDRYLRESTRQNAMIAAATPVIADLVARGEKVAVVHSDAGSNVLLSLDQPNLLDALEYCPFTAQQQAAYQRQALESGTVTVLLVGNSAGTELSEWKSDSVRVVVAGK